MKIAKFWDGSSEGWQYGNALQRLLPNASWQELLPGLVCEWLNGLTDSWRFLPSILQNKSSVWPHLKCMDGSVLAFLYCTDGSLLAILNCTDGSVLTNLDGPYGFVLSHPKFPTQSGLTRFPHFGILLVPWLLWKKSNKGLFTNDVIRWRGGGGLAKKWFFMTRGGGGVRQKVILNDEGGRGGQAKSDFLWQGELAGWQKKIPSKSGMF